MGGREGGGWRSGKGPGRVVLDLRPIQKKKKKKREKKKRKKKTQEEDAQRLQRCLTLIQRQVLRGRSSMTGRQFRKVPHVPFLLLLLLRRLFFFFLFAELHEVVGAYRKWWVFERCNSGSAVVSFQMAVSPWNYERCRVTGEAGGTGVTRRSLFLSLNLLLFCM